MKKIGIYAGSFNPFHTGHLNIYQKAFRLFDDIKVLRGRNTSKTNVKQYNNPKGLTLIEYDGLLTDAIEELKEKDCTYTLIRGLRNDKDFLYESEQSYWIKKLMPKLETIYIECDEEYKHISSSALRELDYYKQDISKYVL